MEEAILMGRFHNFEPTKEQVLDFLREHASADKEIGADLVWLWIRATIYQMPDELWDTYVEKAADVLNKNMV